ncbi:hypothetical protein F5Y19DRAFT_484288 [Xylariaceae sp. FL1651]|nr:hypothetical protein F5Y19DRAFT_484288 [Xylariaceae sp. FL1651]
MRNSYRLQRRASGFRIFVRGDEKLKEDVSNDSKAHGEESSDDDSDEEEEPDTPSPTTTTFPSSSFPEATATSILNPSVTPVVPPTTLLKPSESYLDTATMIASLQSTLPDIPQTNFPPATSTLLSIINPPVVSTSALPTSNPTNLPSPTSALPKNPSSAELGGPSDIPQGEITLSPSDDRAGETSHRSMKAGEIAGATIGSIALIALILSAIWMWRRRMSRITADSRSNLSVRPMPPDDNTQYPYQQRAGASTKRSPSSIMNQLMTAAYAVEDGTGYRNSEHGFNEYAVAEKQRDTIYRNESTERLTVPADGQTRHQSMAARTETTSRTESTWKTWGVLAGSSQPQQGSTNWWVDRYLGAIKAK